MDFLNAFTVDVEDYFQVTGFERDIRREDWEQHESRVVANTRRILDLLERHHVKATFFVLGWVGERFPRLVAEIHRRGHEIGSHGYWHRLIYRQSPEEFRQDVRRSRDALADASGAQVTAYRAPTFSVTRESLWALDILVEEGFQLDSSIFPARHDRYGIPDAQMGIHRITTAAGPLWEFPMSVSRLGRLRLPVGGGGYFRLFPLRWTQACLARINRVRPFVFYIHPWEIDPEQPRMKSGSRMARMRHYVNLESTERKLEKLLAKFRFAPIREAVEAAKQQTKMVAGADA
jgi:polysaccharide deacetylase family protein (PEP-CTERM system associated)